MLSLLLVLVLALCASANRPRACSCSSGYIPVPVDVEIAADPSNPAGLNSTDKRRLVITFQIFGKLCQPVPQGGPSSHDAVQLLLHGQTYSTNYWDAGWSGYQNYSYMAYSCSRGISSFAYDNVGGGRSVRPVNSTDSQMPTAAHVASSLARDLKTGRISEILTGSAKKFKKVVAMGHSLGSATLNYAAIHDGAESPFDSLVLTGHIHDRQIIIKSPVTTIPAREVDPERWGALDPGYITTPNISARSLFYGPDSTTYSQTVLALDNLTADVGSHWLSAQIKFTYTPARGFKGCVVEMVGSKDQAHCLDNGGVPCNQAQLQATEAVYFPDSQSFTMIVLDGYGHDLNLEYSAAQAFSIMTRLFKQFTQ